MPNDRPSSLERTFYWTLLAALVVGVSLFGLHHQGRLPIGGSTPEAGASISGSLGSLSEELRQIRSLLGADSTAAELSDDGDRRRRAAERLEAVLEAHPDSAEAHLLKGLWSLGTAEPGGADLEAARASVERSLELAPGNLHALLTLGTLHYQARELEEAEAIFRRVVELYPNEQAGYHNLGQTLWSQGREEEATEVYRQKLEVKRLQAGEEAS